MKSYIFLLSLVLMISFTLGSVSNFTDTSNEYIQVQQINTTYNTTIAVIDATSCEIVSINTPTHYIIPDGVMYNVTSNNSTEHIFILTATDSFFQERGRYQINIFCEDSVSSSEKILTKEIYVTENGNDYNDYTAITMIAFLVLFCFMFFGLFQLTHKINFEQWYSKIVRRYETRNFIKFVVGSMSYVFIKNSYVLYYLLGLPIVSLINELAFTFNIESLILFAPVLSYTYTFGIVILGILFFSNVQEWIMDLLKQISDINWGFKE